MGSGGMGPGPLSSYPPEKIVEAELSWISSVVLFYSTIYVVLKIDVLWAAFGIAALSLYVLPIVSMRDPFRALPWEMTILVSLPLLLHISAGSDAMNESVAWWDDLTSLAFAFSLATLGFLLTVELQMYTEVRMNRPFAVFFVVMFTLAVSGFWQIGEYVSDVVFATRNQASNGSAMGTLLWSLVGGVLMGFVYAAYIRAMSEERRRALGFMHLWEVRDWKKG
ncbi:MAG: hypothetical protein A3K67_04485 [Euryarchaeota archaeon RBG_16_62_10]|nr:MAG: hypothetical protein A3K67_04485 [Euryarchaeota archaeon RBG_16_62_10]